MPQLQLNSGPQDALLYDNTRSYFTGVGYVRTSNFQVEYREVDAQNASQLAGTTMSFVIPKSADLLGAVDLMVELAGVELSEPGTAGDSDWATWVDEVGYAMIEKATLQIGSNEIETITGEQMQLKNELMTADEMRLGYNQILKTGRVPFEAGDADDNNASGLGELATKGTRFIGYRRKNDTDTTEVNLNPDRQLIIPLNFFFTRHVSQYFPLAAVAGCNDIRISIKFRNAVDLYNTKDGVRDLFSNNTIFKVAPKLMCQYVHVTGPEATDLMNKEHVRLMKMFEQNTLIKKVDSGASKLDINLSFLHPVQELIITVRKVSELNGAGGSSTTSGQNAAEAKAKGFFFYHGGEKDKSPNYDLEQYDSSKMKKSIEVQSIQLKLNGQERHPGLSKGLTTKYLRDRIVPQLHSNSSEFTSNIATVGDSMDFKHLNQLIGTKNIFVYPFSLNPESTNPSGAVNFSKVSHATLTLHYDASEADDYQFDVYAVYYNWLQIKDGRALLSFA